MKTPESLMSPGSAQISKNDKILSDREKTYYSSISSGENGNSQNFSIPICSAEVELLEKTIEEIDFIDGEDKYDLVCLLEKLVTTRDFKILFKYLCPVTAPAAIAAKYAENFFIISIGVKDGWDDGRINNKKDVFGNWDHELEASFDDTNKVCRKYFASFYESTKFRTQENSRGFRLEFPNLLNLLFGNLDLGGLFDWNLRINIEFPDLNFPHKVIKDNPFNKNKEICEESVDKFLQ